MMLLGAGAGCSHDSSNTNNNTAAKTPAARSLRLTAHLRDAQTGAPVQGTLTICGFDSATSDANGDVTIDLDNVMFSDLSLRIDANGYASQSGFIAVNSLTGTMDNNGNLVTFDGLTVAEIGAIDLDRLAGLNVVVTKDGTPVAGATVLAMFDGNNFGQYGPNFFGGPNVGATRLSTISDVADDTTCAVIVTGRTNNSGVATLAVGQTSSYEIFLPSQDLNGDGFADFESVRFQDGSDWDAVDNGLTIAINTTPPSISTASVDVIADSSVAFGTTPGGSNFSFSTGPIIDVTPTAGPAEGVFGSSDVNTRGVDALGNRSQIGMNFNRVIASSDGSLNLVFQEPVTILADGTTEFPTFFYFNNLVDPTTDSTYSAVTPTAVQATVSSSALGTIWTFHPKTAIPDNVTFFVHYFATFGARGHVTVFDESAGDFYHAPRRSAIADPTIDNYDGATGTTVTGTGTLAETRHAYLEFDEPVRGAYAVLAVHDASGIGFNGSAATLTTDENFNAPNGNDTLTDINESGSNSENVKNGSPSLVHNVDVATAGATTEGQLGATKGDRYRTRLRDGNGDFLELHNGATVTLQFNALDASGNTSNKIVTLTVK